MHRIIVSRGKKRMKGKGREINSIASHGSQTG